MRNVFIIELRLAKKMYLPCSFNFGQLMSSNPGLSGEIRNLPYIFEPLLPSRYLDRGMNLHSDSPH